MFMPQISVAGSTPSEAHVGRPSAISCSQILLCEAQLPDPSERPEPTRSPLTHPPEPKQRNFDSALGVAHGALSMGVGAATLYLSLNFGAHIVASLVFGVVARNMALNHLLSDYQPAEASENELHGKLEYYRSAYAFGRFLGFCVTAFGTGVGLAQGGDAQSVCLLLQLSLGAAYGFMGRRGMPFEVPAQEVRR